MKGSFAMKKILLCTMVLSLLVSITAFAEEAKKDEMPGMGMSHGMRMGMGMPMPGMGQKYCPAGNAQMVATDEGGVFVLTGNKLMKYDADLNMVKEVEVKMPMPPMMGKQCPIMGKTAEPASVVSQTKQS
jgi:outer membrane lipoprotein-sorting protein